MYIISNDPSKNWEDLTYDEKAISIANNDDHTDAIISLEKPNLGSSNLLRDCFFTIPISDKDIVLTETYLKFYGLLKLKSDIKYSTMNKDQEGIVNTTNLIQ